MQIVTQHQQVVLAGRIVGTETDGIEGRDETGVCRAEPPIGARKPETPLPLLANDLDERGSYRRRYETMPDDEARRENGRDPDRSACRKPVFQAAVFRLVRRMRLVRVPESENAVGHEQNNSAES